MHQDRRGSRHHIVGVEAVDGQVVGDLGGGVVAGLGDGGGGAVRLLEFVARFDAGGVYERRLDDVVERVGRSGDQLGRGPRPG